MIDVRLNARGHEGAVRRSRSFHGAGLGIALLVAAGISACSLDPAGLLLPPASLSSHAAVVPSYGVKASGSELFTPGIVTDGGPGSTTASVSTPNFVSNAQLADGATYLPRLSAFSQNTTAANDDDRTQSTAEGYQVFTSAIDQTVELTVRLSGTVVDDLNDTSYILADVFVYGGPAFAVGTSSICPDGSLAHFLFDGTYFCGSRLDRANLYIPAGDLVLLDTLTFSVSAGAPFGVYAVLSANSSGGTADASQTLVLEFTDDSNISALDFPGGPSTDLEVRIDVKPGSDPATINLRSRGVLPVAILSDDAFDATTVDPLSVRLAGAGVRSRGRRLRPMATTEDVDGDGLADLVVHVETQELAPGATGSAVEIVLTGRTFDGIAIRGTDEVRIIS